MQKPGGHRSATDRELYKVLHDNAQVVDGKYIFQQPLARLARLAKLSTDETRRLLGHLEGRGAVNCIRATGLVDKYVLNDSDR